MQLGGCGNRLVVSYPAGRPNQTHAPLAFLQIPPDLLRRHVVSISADAEAFLVMRSQVRVRACVGEKRLGLRETRSVCFFGPFPQFAKSMAVFNACSYILGIGDRHLDNFLFNNVRRGASGLVVGCCKCRGRGRRGTSVDSERHGDPKNVHTLWRWAATGRFPPLQSDGTVLGIDFGLCSALVCVAVPVSVR